MLTNSIFKNSIVLGIFALVTATILALTFLLTLPHIKASEKRAAQKALLEIMPAHTHDNDMLEDHIALSKDQAQALGFAADKREAPVQAHLAKKDGAVVAVVLPSVAPDGYSGDIKIIVGVLKDGSVAGVRVLSHRETPGLGDKIELAKSNWITTFTGKRLGDPKLQQWTVKKSGGAFDQFTGATITPKAVVRRVKNTLLFMQKNHAMFFAEAKSKQPTEN